MIHQQTAYKLMFKPYLQTEKKIERQFQLLLLYIAICVIQTCTCITVAFVKMKQSNKLVKQM